MRIINLVEDTPGNRGCGYEHGLSFYVETKAHKLLVDSGATDLFLRNAEILGVDPEQADALIVSHGHYDHGGGIRSFASLNPRAKIYIRSCAGEEYYHLKDSGEKYIGIDRSVMQLEQVIAVDSDLRIDDELFLFTGITGTRFPAKGNRELMRREGNAFVPDDFGHEQCLVITQGDERVLMSGCAHNGILNILDRYRELFHSFPDAVISGFHLMQKDGYAEADIKNIESIAHALLETGAVFYTGHCTGQEAFGIMKKIMGGRLKEVHSGDVIF